uniref:Uncharacterized protein n=1 Tax=Plectus sambesii TaxID=2011161 RepID=A0A914URS8_9BILA
MATTLNPFKAACLVLLLFVTISSQYELDPQVNEADCTTRDCEETHLAVAILLSPEGKVHYLGDVRKYILKSIKGCLENEDRKRFDVDESGLTGLNNWCELTACVEESLTKVDMVTSDVAADRIGKNETASLLGAKTGRLALDPKTIEYDDVPELTLLTTYKSQPLGRMYEATVDLNREPIRVSFRLTIVSAPAHFFRYSLNATNPHAQFCRNFKSLSEASDHFCVIPAKQEESSGSGWFVFLAFLVVLLLIAAVVGLFWYEKKRDQKRNKGENLKRNIVRLRADNQALKEQLGSRDALEKLMVDDGTNVREVGVPL